MGLFERLERALERLIEGKLMGGFRGRVHPVEIARRVAQQMQADRRIGVSRTYVPNAFVVRLHPVDFEPLAPIEREVEDEIITYLERQVRERDYALPGRLRIRLEADPALGSGTVEVRASFERDETSPSVELPRVPSGGSSRVPSGEMPRVPSGESSRVPSGEMPRVPTPLESPPGTRAVLLGKSGFVQGKVVPLKTDVLIVGRSPDCGVHVGDSQVSKSHARLDWNGGTYVLTSSGRNGTLVNGEPLTAPRVLRNGDDIGLGSSSFHYRLLNSPI